MQKVKNNELYIAHLSSARGPADARGSYQTSCIAKEGSLLTNNMACSSHRHVFSIKSQILNGNDTYMNSLIINDKELE